MMSSLLRSVPVAAIILIDMVSLVGAQPTAGDSPGIQVRVGSVSRSPGVPDGTIACRGRATDGRPSLHCTIRFDSPIDVQSARVIDPAGNLEWTPVFRPFDPAEDDTAYFVLIDRRGAVQREMRDLADVFSRLRGREQVAVATYANDLTLIQPFTSDRNAIKDAFARIRPGGTASELYRHCLESVRQLQLISAGQKVLLIASSGKSDDTAYKREDVENAARQANVRIVSLGYAEQTSTPNLQALERMSAATNGRYYKAEINRPLSQEIRNAILTQFSGGGTLDATAPTRGIPASVNVTLRHPDNRSTSFPASLAVAAAGGSVAEQTTRMSTDEDSPLARWYNAITNPWIASAVAALLLAILLILTMIARAARSRHALAPAGSSSATLGQLSDLAPEPPPPTNALPTSGSIAAGLANDAVSETVIRKPAISEPEAPILAWLEFNAHPGRVPVRKKHITIGRLADNDIVTDPGDDTVSRHHAVISINTNGRFQITNQSTVYRSNPNPIFVNDREVERAELSDGDRVKLGTGNYGFVFVEVRPS